MQLFYRELKAHRKGLFFWSLGMAFLVASDIAKFNAYKTSGTSLSSLIDKFPKSVQIIFGINGFDLSKASGYYGVLFLYLALMATIHAVLLGAEIISKEERDRTAEFLLVRPIGRRAVLRSKLFAGFCNLIVLNFVTLISSLIFISYFNKGNPLAHTVFIFMGGIFFLQLIFFTIGIAVATVRSKPKSSATIASSILLTTLILSYLIDFNDRFSSLKIFTPFKYFDAKTLLQQNGLDPKYVVLSLCIIVALLIISFTSYSKRDIDC